jgi:hypothetical protein
MIITETMTFTRANTSISWPMEGYTFSSNNLIASRQGVDFTTTITVDNELTKKTITTWTNLEKLIEVKTSSSNEDNTKWLTTTCVPGLTIVKTIETSA